MGDCADTDVAGGACVAIGHADTARFVAGGVEGDVELAREVGDERHVAIAHKPEDAIDAFLSNDVACDLGKSHHAPFYDEVAAL